MEPLFYFTRKERRAIIVLVALITGFMIAHPLLPSRPVMASADFQSLRSRIDSMAKEQVKAEESLYVISKTFDVNEVTSSGLQGMGLSQTISDRWIKYREAIGGFREFSQVRKIYGLDTIWYSQALPFMSIRKKKDHDIKTQSKVLRTTYAVLSGNDEAAMKSEKSEVRIRQDSTVKKYYKNPAPARTEETIDINLANEWQWQLLYGIGPYYAKRIITFRDKLGGFASIGQVAETYGLPDSTFQKIKEDLTISPINRRISINSVTADSLKLHPYISRKQANILARYRDQHGPYSSAQDFYKVKVFDSAFVKRIEPYLLF